MTRTFIPKKHPSLVAVIHQCVLHAPNGLGAHEVLTLMGYDSYGTGMAELTQEGRKFDADRVLPAMDATDSDAPLHFLARQRNGVFLHLPEPAQGGGALAEALAASAKEYAEFMQETAVSISDGRIPRDQLDRITKEGQEAVEAILAMMKLARITHEDQYGGEK